MILLNHHKTKRKKAILMYQNYTIGQTALTLNLDFAIPHNHLANTISWFVDSIPEDVLLGNTAKTGRPAYHPAMMLKILLFAYSRRVFSGRKIELMLEENVPMMLWLNTNRFLTILSITLDPASMPMSWLRKASSTLPIC